MACIHGFAPSDCLICSTLQSGDKSGSPSTQTVQTATRPAEAPLSLAATPSRPLAERHGAKSAPAGRDRSHGQTFVHVLAILAIIVIAIVAFDLFFDIVRGLIHVLELAVVGVVAAVIGYGVGRVHGRRPKDG
jgi:hypothetical protein